MGSRSRSLKVKVPRTKLIEALTEAANDRRKSIVEHDKALEKWESEKAAAEKDFLDRLKSGMVETNKVSMTYMQTWLPPYDSSGKQEKELKVTITFNVPATVMKLPEMPKQQYENSFFYITQSCHGWSLKEDIEEIENTIRILSLSTDEFVSTSTYKSVARFL